jgi:hypothetical protein
MASMTTATPINTEMHRTSDNLLVHVPRSFDHHPLDGNQLGDSIGGSSFEE